MRIALVDDCPNDLSIMHQFLAEALDISIFDICIISVPG